MEKVQAYYQEPAFCRPTPGPLAKTVYQAECIKVQRAFSDWMNSQWQSGRRDSEEELMNAILALNESFPTDVNNEYRHFLAQNLHLLTAVTMDQSHYLLDDPGIVFAEFLVHEQSYRSFVDTDEDFTALAWLCVSVAYTFNDEPNGDEKGVVDTLVYRMAARHIADSQSPSSKDVVDVLYGPSCWDLYSLDDGNQIYNMPANAIRQAGLRVLTSSEQSKRLDSVNLPSDVYV